MQEPSYIRTPRQINKCEERDGEKMKKVLVLHPTLEQVQ